MAVVKKVRKNKPFRNAYGQYNFTGSINVGIDPVFDDKFMDRDLYSINLSSDVNEAILNHPVTVPISDTSHFTIDELVVKNAGVSYGVKNMKFTVHVIDSENEKCESRYRCGRDVLHGIVEYIKIVKFILKNQED